jgi:hypothetical protein
MKRKNFFLLIGVLLMIQVNAQKVHTDFDKDSDFTKFKTFAFLGWQNNSGDMINDLDKERLRNAFRSELDQRQLETAGEDEADLAVTLFLVVEQKTSTTAYTDYYNGSYGGYRRGAWGWGGGSSTTTYSENDYLKGTLVMDVYDNETKKLVWQAVASSTINENPKKREKGIPKTVKKIMKHFPIEPVK